MSQPSIPRAIEDLNQASLRRWGNKAPRYSHVVRRGVYFIHRIRQDISPFLPADELWARGSKDHCLAKLRSAIRYANDTNQSPSPGRPRASA